MNALEKMAIAQLKAELNDLSRRCSNENKDRLATEQIFMQGNLKRAFEIIRAIEDNSKE